MVGLQELFYYSARNIDNCSARNLRFRDILCAAPAGFQSPNFFAPAKLILQFTKLSPRRSFKSFTILGKIFEIYYGQQIHSYCTFVWRKNEPKIPFVKKNDTCEV